MKCYEHCGQELVDDVIVGNNCGREIPRHLVENIEGSFDESRLVF